MDRAESVREPHECNPCARFGSRPLLVGRFIGSAGECNRNRYAFPYRKTVIMGVSCCRE
jgi:hypothetical protein